MNKLKQNNLLYLVTDRGICGDRSLEEVVKSAVLGGVNLVQLREKGATTEEFLRIGKSLKSVLDFYNIPLIINDRIDIAVELDACGVHLGQSDVSYEEARKILGNKKIIGLSVNTLEEAKKAESLDVDYLGVAPIFSTKTKLDVGKVWELHELKKLRKFSRHILVGIGGIDHDNVGKIIKIGFNGVAIVSAICGAKDPKESAEKFFDMFREAK